MRSLIALAALALMSCAPVANDPAAPVAPPVATSAPVTKPDLPSGQVSAADCAARGGSMQPVGRMQSRQCVIPFADGGRACTDGSQCSSGRCIDESPEATPSGPVSGVCQRTNFQFGCYAAVSGGRQQPVICVD